MGCLLRSQDSNSLRSSLRTAEDQSPTAQRSAQAHEQADADPSGSHAHAQAQPGRQGSFTRRSAWRLTLWRREGVPADRRVSLLCSWAVLLVRRRVGSPRGCPRSAGTPEISVDSVLGPPLSAMGLYPVERLAAPGTWLKEVLHRAAKPEPACQ